MNRIRFVRTGGLMFGAALFLAASPVSAGERPTDPRWLPWLGCWQSTEARDDHLICIRPLDDDLGVEMVTYADGSIVSQEILRADGEQRALTREGCNGWESAEFSEDGKRVYLRSEFACEGDVRRNSSGLISMSSPASWLDVQVVGVAGNNAVRALRYTLASPERLDAAGVEPVAEDRAMAVSAARTAAATPLTVEDIIDVSANLTPEAVEAWVVERGDELALDSKKLVQMADAGVPESVIDLVVAVSFPNTFAINAEGREGEFRATEPRSGESADEYAYPGYYDPFYWDPFRFGRYGYYSPWGYYGYGGGPGWYYPGRPIVIIPGGDDSEAEPRMRRVKGQGYTRGGRTVSEPGSQGSYQPPSRRAGDRRPDAGAVTRGSGSSSSGTKAASPSSGSTGRKAKPRGGGGTG